MKALNLIIKKKQLTLGISCLFRVFSVGLSLSLFSVSSIAQSPQSTEARVESSLKILAHWPQDEELNDRLPQERLKKPIQPEGEFFIRTSSAFQPHRILEGVIQWVIQKRNEVPLGEVGFQARLDAPTFANLKHEFSGVSLDDRDFSFAMVDSVLRFWNEKRTPECYYSRCLNRDELVAKREVVTGYVRSQKMKLHAWEGASQSAEDLDQFWANVAEGHPAAVLLDSEDFEGIHPVIVFGSSLGNEEETFLSVYDPNFYVESLRSLKLVQNTDGRWFYDVRGIRYPVDVKILPLKK